MLVLVCALKCHRVEQAEAAYLRATLLFDHGELESSQELARSFSHRFRGSDPGWSSRFTVLEAEAALWRSMYGEVIRLLNPLDRSSLDRDLAIKRFNLLSLSYSNLNRIAEADDSLKQADALCSVAESAACGFLLRTHASQLRRQGLLPESYAMYAQSLALARRFGQSFDESSSLVNLGQIRLRQDRFDEAIDWSTAASDMASQLHYGDIELWAQGNLGWAYYKLGDAERAQELFMQAEKKAKALGDNDGEITWVTTSGVVYQDSLDFKRAADAYGKALAASREIGNQSQELNSLESLVKVSIEAKRLDDAERYLKQAEPLIRANGNQLDALDLMLSRGKIQVARDDWTRAEDLFRAVESDRASQSWMRMASEHELANLYSAQRRVSEAEGMFQAALTTFEGARDQLKKETSRLPFLANATPIYDDYVGFLVSQGKSEAALMIADHSRARALAQGLDEASASGVKLKEAGFHQGSRGELPGSLSAQVLSRKAGATLLFYWLGERQSFLWAVTPQKTERFDLPARAVVAPLVERYRRLLQGVDDPLQEGSAANEAGRALYAMLVAPAAGLMGGREDVNVAGVSRPVMILADGALSELNFETLIAPGAPADAEMDRKSDGKAGFEGGHYWIEDATVTSAPSIAMLAAAKPAAANGGRLLLLGDPVSPGKTYPELPLAAEEVRQVEGHFGGKEPLVFRREAATPGAYLRSDPGKFAYIHFVSHGVASRMDPLDSAIILSRADGKPGSAGGGEDEFKLYAREVMRHPIDARLVTISACYGSGSRTYAGEGLVGLSWAFLRAGAHNAIGALWEASDESTPRLMGTLYGGLDAGLSPGEALRQAKLELLHSHGKFHKPYYWAPFQLYTRL